MKKILPFFEFLDVAKPYRFGRAAAGCLLKSAKGWKSEEEISMKIERRTIDWINTGKNLRLLRNDNLALRRYVCKTLRRKHGECDGQDCESCRFEMDLSISQAELAEVFHVSENMLLNWEKARSKPALEDLLFYADICGLSLFDVVVFKE